MNIETRITKKGVRWDAVVCMNGRRIKKKTFTRKKDAEDWIAEMRPETRAGTWRELRQATLSEYVEHWRRVHLSALKASTRRSYSSLIEKWLVPALGDLPMAGIGPAEVGALKADVLSKRSAKTTRNVLTLAGRILSDAIADECLKHSPMAGMKKPAFEKRKVRALTPDEVKGVLAALEGKPARLPVLSAYLTGLRQAELFGLQWEDIDFDGGLVNVRRALDWNWGGEGRHWRLTKPKTANSVRSVELAAELKAELKVFHESQGRGGGFVFRTKGGGPLVPQNVYRRHLKPLLAKLPTKGGRVNWHSLRHSYASALLTAGVDIFYVSRSLGHSSISITADVVRRTSQEADGPKRRACSNR